MSIRELLHLHGDDNSSSTLQLHHWPRQHLRHETAPHVQGCRGHRQQERDARPARVCTSGSVEQVGIHPDHSIHLLYILIAKQLHFNLLLALARVPTRIWRACTTMMTLTCPWWCATMLLRLRSSPMGRGICWGKETSTNRSKKKSKRISPELVYSESVYVNWLIEINSDLSLKGIAHSSPSSVVYLLSILILYSRGWMMLDFEVDVYIWVLYISLLDIVSIIFTETHNGDILFFINIPYVRLVMNLTWIERFTAEK